MALEIAFYKVTKDVAIRSGLIEERYRTKDNHYILDNKDLSRVRLTSEEYITGLKGIERIPENEVETLIAEGGYKFGYDDLVEDEETNLQAENVEQAETTTDNEETGGETNVDSNAETQDDNVDESGDVVNETSENNDESLENDDEQEQENNENQEEE